MARTEFEEGNKGTDEQEQEAVTIYGHYNEKFNTDDQN